MFMSVVDKLEALVGSFALRSEVHSFVSIPAATVTLDQPGLDPRCISSCL